MAIPGIDRLRRRPQGDRVLVYLDQSSRSRLAEGKFPTLLAILKSRRFICPESGEHEYETVLCPAEGSFQAISEVGEELSMGVRFRDRDEILFNEIRAATASFLGLGPPTQLWREAFSEDPHAPLEELFPLPWGRVAFKPEKVDWMEEEATVEKGLPLMPILSQMYDQARAAGVTFDQQAEVEYRENVKCHLWPLVDPKAYADWVEAAREDARRERASGADITRSGSAFNRFIYRRRIGEFARSLLDEFPTLNGRENALLRSEELRSVPFLRYPALLWAALFCTPGRKAKPGDTYDIWHLTLGLSRCDFVTADGSMVERCRERGLIPAGVGLYTSRGLGQLAADLAQLPEQ